MDNFDFNIGNKNIPVVNLTDTRLSFNRAAIIALGYPEYVSIGLDKINKKVAVKAVGNESGIDGVRRYRFADSERKKKYITLSVGRLRGEILKIINMELHIKRIKFNAYFDDGKQLLIINLE